MSALQIIYYVGIVVGIAMFCTVVAVIMLWRKDLF